MPCLFLKNVPERHLREGFAVEASEAFLRAFALAADVGLNEVQVHIEEPHPRYWVLHFDGRLLPHKGVHAVLEWHARPLEAAQGVAAALQDFLDFHGIGEGSDLTVRNSPPGETFFLEGRLAGGVEDERFEEELVKQLALEGEIGLALAAGAPPGAESY